MQGAMQVQGLAGGGRNSSQPTSASIRSEDSSSCLQKIRATAMPFGQWDSPRRLAALQAADKTLGRWQNRL